MENKKKRSTPQQSMEVVPSTLIDVLLTPGGGELGSKEMQLHWRSLGKDVIKYNGEQILTTATIDSLGAALGALAFPSQWYPALHLLTAWVRRQFARCARAKRSAPFRALTSVAPLLSHPPHQATKVSRAPDTLVTPAHQAAYVTTCARVVGSLNEYGLREAHARASTLPALALVRSCKLAAAYARAVQRGGLGVRILEGAIALLQPLGTLDGLSLTPLHPALLKHCIATQHYAEGAALASRDVLLVDPDCAAISETDAPAYFYAAGVVFIALERWSAAIEALERCITLPAAGPSDVLADAYKKLVLVHLIAEGRAPTLPPHALPDAVERALLRPETMLDAVRAYQTVGDAYGSPHFARLVERHSDVFAADGNRDLALQCVASVAAFRVKRLAIAYVALPLADVAAKAGLADGAAAARLIAQLVARDEIVAKIDAVAGTVTFEVAGVRSLDVGGGSSAQLAALEAVTIEGMHEQLALTIELAQKLQRVRVLQLLLQLPESLLRRARRRPRAAAHAPPHAARCLRSRRRALTFAPPRLASLPRPRSARQVDEEITMSEAHVRLGDGGLRARDADGADSGSVSDLLRGSGEW
jgi:hypothetical protein